MSSILKALRKLEEQQAARRGGTASAARQVPPPGSRWRAPTAILATVVLAVAGTVAVMNSLNSRTAQETVSPPGQKERSKPAAAIRLPEPVVPGETVSTPVAVSDQGTGSAPAAADGERLTLRSVVPPPPVPRQRTVHAVPALQEIEAATPFAAAARVAQTQQQPPSQPQAKPVDRALALPPPPPSLTVSGIAWQKGESDRIAMVNGSPVSEGTVVAGAKVLEIKPDRVRFSRDGATFDVPIGTGTAAR